MNDLEREARKTAWKVTGNITFLIILMAIVYHLFGCSHKRVPMQTRSKYDHVK